MKQPKENKKDAEVTIFIGILEWNENAGCLKQERSKRIPIRVPTAITCGDLQSKEEEKWKTFHSNLYIQGEIYYLLYEDGLKADFLPGSFEHFDLN